MYSEEIRAAFRLALGRLVHAHAEFDFNIGLQLNWLGHDNNQNVSKFLVGKRPFDWRLEKAEELVFKQYSSAPTASLAELREWFSAARKMKDLRNDYAHARWSLPGYVEGDDPEFRMTPLNWNMDPDQKDASVPIKLSELHVAALEIERLGSGLGAWMIKHLAYATPRAT
jgi:hypothetical protein